MTAKKRIMRKAVPGYTLIPRNGYYEARKIGITGSRVKADPAYALTRRHAKEFGYAAKIGKLIRGALMGRRTAGNSAGRLTSALLKAVHADEENEVGERSLLHADLSSLIGFEFNPQYSWPACCCSDVTVTRMPGSKVQVLLPAFVPVEKLHGPDCPAWFRIGFSLIAVDTVAGSVSTTTADTGLLPFNSTKVGKHSFTLLAQDGNVNVHMLFGCIEWYKVVNGKPQPLTQYTVTIIDAWSTCCTRNNPAV